MNEYIFEPEASTQENIQAARTQILGYGAKLDKIHPTGDISFYRDLMPIWGPVSIILIHMLGFIGAGVLAQDYAVFFALIPILFVTLGFSIVKDEVLYALVSSKSSQAYEKMKLMIELPEACTEALYILHRVNESLSKLNVPDEASTTATASWAEGQELALEVARLTKEADDPAWVLRQDASQQLILLAARMLVVEKLAQDRAHAHLLLEPVAKGPEEELLALTSAMADENDVVSRILAGDFTEKQATGDVL